MSHDNLPVKNPDLGHSVADPGIEEHIERFTDVNEGAGNRAYRAILLMLAAVPVLAIAFVVIYFAVPRNACKRASLRPQPWAAPTASRIASTSRP